MWKVSEQLQIHHCHHLVTRIGVLLSLDTELLLPHDLQIGHQHKPFEMIKQVHWKQSRSAYKHNTTSLFLNQRAKRRTITDVVLCLNML